MSNVLILVTIIIHHQHLNPDRLDTLWGAG